jgi:basic amino acid/polyamine antiporter, APA family
MQPSPSPVVHSTPSSNLTRQVGLFDATMVVMGGIVGAGIFINPYVVAQRVHTPVLILSAWLVGGAMAMLGAFIYAELADRMPEVGGQYAYLREAYHPALGFLYGWVLLLVIQTGGMAAVTVTFARYFLELTGWQASERLVAVLALIILTVVNCLGVKLGSRVQSGLMVLKIGAIAGLVCAGLFLIPFPHPVLHPVLDQPVSFGLLSSFGAAMIPILFAYGGWQTANFIAGEIKDPRRNLPRALLMGVAGVIALYVTVNLVCVRAMGPDTLSKTTVPATAVMRLALGERGAMLIAFGIAISTLGFLCQSVLTAPRVYFAMAEHGVFFRSVARVNARTRVPVTAIVLQSVWVTVVALSGRYEQILNYVVSMDFIFFGLTATCIFIFRRREKQKALAAGGTAAGFRVPGHPWTTGTFILISWLVVANTIYKYPANSLLGMLILFLGLPVYAFWHRRQRAASTR